MLEPVASLLAKQLRKKGLYKYAEASAVVTKAQKWLEDHLPNFTDDIQVETFKDGCLLIACANSIALQEARFVQNELHSYLSNEKDAFQDQNLEDIRIVRAK